MTNDDIEVHEERMETDELLAMALLAIGALWWIGVGIVTFAAGNMTAFWAVVVLAALSMVALTLGWRFERSVAALLLASAVAMVGWGIYMSWDPAIWVLMGATIGVELLVDAGLLLAARHEETIVEHETHKLPIKGAHTHA